MEKAVEKPQAEVKALQQRAAELARWRENSNFAGTSSSSSTRKRRKGKNRRKGGREGRARGVCLGLRSAAPHDVSSILSDSLLFGVMVLPEMYVGSGFYREITSCAFPC